MVAQQDKTGAIFDIKKFAIHDGPGIRTTVFLTGCPMDCWWCHNPEGRGEAPTDPTAKTRRVTVAHVMEEIEKDRVFYDQSGGGATFSGGEPMAQPEFLVALLKECRRRQIATAVDTCGYAPPGDFDKVADLVDLFLYDLKIMDDERHRTYTGVSNGPVLENLKLLARSGRRIQLRIPLIPGITDTEDNLESILSFLDDLPAVRRVSLLPYNRFGEDKRKRYKLPVRLERVRNQSETEIEAAAERFKSHGFDVKIGG
ncbi:MAG: glycyl-radical enzyme activating protein [Candidatus Zixiibacteriota bacterium]|nr:MAG: glycyl-radical enzyme activating protein [candidate division Zixibacteria bacterium]